jgi:hypothetical protein
MESQTKRRAEFRRIRQLLQLGDGVWKRPKYSQMSQGTRKNYCNKVQRVWVQRVVLRYLVKSPKSWHHVNCKESLQQYKASVNPARNLSTPAISRHNILSRSLESSFQSGMPQHAKATHE